MRAWILSIAGLITAVGQPLLGEDASRTVSVSAQSEIMVAPDEAIVSFAVTSSDEELLTAKKTNDETTRPVLAFVRKQGVAEEHLRITDFDLAPQHNRGGDVIGYSVRRQFEVRLYDFGKVEPLLSGLIDAGVRQIDRLRFQVKDQRKPQREARRLAFEYAKEKATHLAELAGMQLGGAVSVQESVQYNRDAGGFGGFGGGGFGSLGSATITEEPQTAGADRFTPPGSASPGRFRFAADDQPAEDKKAEGPEQDLVTPGLMRLNATVSVDFELLKP